MWLRTAIAHALINVLYVAGAPATGTLTERNNGGSCLGPFDDINLSAPDGSIKATFIAAGAHITNLWVKDQKGDWLDVILGYDDRTQYFTDLARPYFGAIVGRYANRIKNGTFTQPNGKVVHVAENDNKGLDTLHGGWFGYDQRVWNVTQQSANSVTFGLYDPNGKEGFSGSVKSYVTYKLENGSKWAISMKAYPDSQTPIMMSQHTYWNLDGYKYSQDLQDHYIQVAADKYVQTDGILIPTGPLPSVNGTALDLRQPTQLSSAINKTQGTGLCGTGCTGLDNCLLYSNPIQNKNLTSVYSTKSGVRLDIETNQIALQLYTCNGVAATRNITRKADQGGNNGGTYSTHSCFVLEQQSYIDGINNPSWKIDQYYDSNRTYDWESVYTFSVQR